MSLSTYHDYSMQHTQPTGFLKVTHNNLTLQLYLPNSNSANVYVVYFDILKISLQSNKLQQHRSPSRPITAQTKLAERV